MKLGLLTVLNLLTIYSTSKIWIIRNIKLILSNLNFCYFALTIQQFLLFCVDNYFALTIQQKYVIKNNISINIFLNIQFCKIENRPVILFFRLKNEFEN